MQAGAQENKKQMGAAHLPVHAGLTLMNVFVFVFVFASGIACGPQIPHFWSFDCTQYLHPQCSGEFPGFHPWSDLTLILRLLAILALVNVGSYCGTI